MLVICLRAACIFGSSYWLMLVLDLGKSLFMGYGLIVAWGYMVGKHYSTGLNNRVHSLIQKRLQECSELLSQILWMTDMSDGSHRGVTNKGWGLPQSPRF